MSCGEFLSGPSGYRSLPGRLVMRLRVYQYGWESRQSNGGKTLSWKSRQSKLQREMYLLRIDQIFRIVKLSRYKESAGLYCSQYKQKTEL